MAKSNRPNHVSKPTYPGGVAAMQKFVRENLQYPAEAKQLKKEGSVTVRYSLDYRGKVVATKIKKSLGYGCDEEAMRVVSLLRFVVPQDSKKKVRIHQDIQIHFKLPQPKAKPKTKSLKITYTPAAKPASTKEAPAAKSSGYGYTIKW